MLSGVFEFIGEIIFEGLVELFSWRIEDHPYYTCLYRGLLIAAPLYIGLTIKHYFFDKNLTQMAFSDAGWGLGVWAFLSALLIIIAFYRKREQNRY